MTRLAKKLCYCARPNRYFDDMAESVAELYDGFFFTFGSWDEGVIQYIGLDGPPKRTDWLESVGKNIGSLNKAGATENFLTVHFSTDGDWPSPGSLLSEEFTEKMERAFTATGKTSQELGFRGVCVDVEYPYPRYSVEHEVYDYDGYTVEDLLDASRNQGRVCAGAILNEHPEAVIITLPGSIRVRPICRNYLIGILDKMASRGAPGGFHLGTEFSYGLHDPVTQVAITRFGDLHMNALLSGEVLKYWDTYCTVAPGVWPLHMVETGGEGYPVRPWGEEIVELRRQMAILRTLAKRYIWSYSGNPAWYVHSEELERDYDLPPQNLKRPDIDLKDWHAVLADEPIQVPEVQELIVKIREYDSGVVGSSELCDAFGTPAKWWVLGILGNPGSEPKFFPKRVVQVPFDSTATYHGRDTLLRWFTYDNFDLIGITHMRHVFDWRGIEAASAHLYCTVYSPAEVDCQLNLGWDDQLEVRINDQIVFQQIEYGKGHGFLYRDRYCYEDRAQVHLNRGRNEIMVTTSNDYGNWIFSFRFTDNEGVPVRGLKFNLD